MFGNVYNGRNVFITGHTGFKGSWLSSWLLNMGARVTGFSRDIPSQPSNFEALNLADKITDIRGDVRDLGHLSQIMQDSQPEVIFHLAAQALVRTSYEDPVNTMETNMLGVMNILEAARKLPSIKAIVIITSDKCYRNEEWIWGYRETDRLGGSDPYSASKGCAEIIAHSYFDSFYREGAACATARAGNVIGGGDWARDRIIPDCARAWADKRAVEIRNPSATRPWQHVLEPLSGYLVLGQKLLESSRDSGIHGQSYNFGPAADVNKSVAQVVNGLRPFWSGFSSILDPVPENQKKESTLLKLCCDKALAELDWKAVLNFEETIAYTALWYDKYYKGIGDMWNFTLGQISDYCNAARERRLAWASD